ncbi:MAG TPA: MFS transporter, partial [Acetobacteraceae bacterium]|nr:MFS transporter [Acetobacteraceae bacterium]
MNHSGEARAAASQGPGAGRPSWKPAFAAVSLMQMVASFMMLCLPICGPALTAHFHLAPQRIGLIGGTVWGGSLAFVFAGGFIVDRLPPDRLLQIVGLASAAGLALALIGSTPLLFLGAFILGLAYGPNVPAGSRVLAARTPRNRSGLIFSLKQAAVPVGNALGGLILTPLAAAHGYRSAVIAAIVTGIAAAACLLPLHRHLAVPPGAPARRGLRETMVAPVALVIRNPGLRLRSVLALALASAQSITTNLLVAYLVSRIGLPLARAGMVFAVLQGGGFAGRILCGWIADRSRNVGRNLAWQAMASALTMAMLAALPKGAPLLLLMPVAALTGLIAFSWNGVFLSEAAALAPPGAIAETTTGAVSVIYLA